MLKIFFKVSSTIFLFTLLFISSFLLASDAQAASGNCLLGGKTMATVSWPDQFPTGSILNITIHFTPDMVPGRYNMIITDGKGIAIDFESDNVVILSSSQLVTGVDFGFSISKYNAGKYYVKLQKAHTGAGGANEDICDPSSLGTILIVPSTGGITGVQCTINMSGSTQIGTNIAITPSISNATSANNRFLPLVFKKADFAKIPTVPFTPTGDLTRDFPNRLIIPSIAAWLKEPTMNQPISLQTGPGTFFDRPNNEFVFAIGILDDVTKPSSQSLYYVCNSRSFTISNTTTAPPTSTSGSFTPTPTPGAPRGLPRAVSAAGTTCPTSPAPGTSLPAAGCSCSIKIGTDNTGAPAEYEGIGTAIGCIPTQPIGFVRATFRFGLSIGGGIAFLLIIMAVFQIMTSAGNPQTLKEGGEKLTNAIIGLLFIVFAVLILQIIGAGILNLPGFSGP